MLFICSLVASAIAHNWVNSPSRSQFASTVNPALPSQTGLPHAKVIAGQDVQVEWVNGHDSDCYLILLPEKDSMKNMLKQNNAALEDYINNAPAGQLTPPPPRWQKYHRKYNSANLDNKAGDAFFAGILRPTDVPLNPWFMLRPDTFEGSLSGAPGVATRNVSLIYMAQYYQNTSCTLNDRRVQYTNPKYPWIIAAHRYRLCTGQASRPDVARVTFPEGTPPGRYVIQWQWRGYYDVIDVEIVAGTTPVAKPYGEKVPMPPAGARAQYRRVDHCAFPEAIPTLGCYRLMTDADACMRMCDRSTEFGCTGVQVTPVIFPTGAYSGFRNVSFMPYDVSTACRKSDIERGAHQGHLACWPLQARPKTDTSDRQVITNDPDDPVFYSTCYIRISYKVAGNDTIEAPPRDPQWQFRHKCINCDYAQISTIEYAVPQWNISQTCANCEVAGRTLDQIPAAMKPVNYTGPAPWKNFIGNAVCRGMNNMTENPNYSCVNATNCFLQLAPAGGSRADVGEQDLRLLAKSDPRCSSLAMMRYDRSANYVGWCWRGSDAAVVNGAGSGTGNNIIRPGSKGPTSVGDQACCGDCVPQLSGSYRLWEK